MDIRPENEENAPSAGRTLADVLYSRPDAAAPPESEWSGLVRGTASGELAALHALYERAGRLVFVLAMRITGSRAAAQDVTVEVFADVWRRAWSYSAADGTVLAWVMNQARSRAREHARYSTLSLSQQASAPVASSDAIAPSGSVQSRVARRIADHDGVEPTPPAPPSWTEPDWNEVSQGISCKLLATDSERQRVSMLVRLEPGTEYPPHTHAGLEELHLLDGELCINGNKVVPGDYYRAEASTSDSRVYSETGCTCVLITSTKDKLL